MKIINELREEINDLKNRNIELAIRFEVFQKKVLTMVKRGFLTEDDPFYEREHLEKPVRSIVQDILEEKERLG